MTDYIIGNSLRCGKSIKYNRVSKEKALDVYKGEILPQKKTLLNKFTHYSFNEKSYIRLTDN